jgi:hypothetical protein
MKDEDAAYFTFTTHIFRRTNRTTRDRPRRFSAVRPLWSIGSYTRALFLGA